MGLCTRLCRLMCGSGYALPSNARYQWGYALIGASPGNFGWTVPVGQSHHRTSDGKAVSFPSFFAKPVPELSAKRMKLS